MYRNLKVCAVIPSYNEEKLITKTIRSLPMSIDMVVAINDGSTDNTLTVLNDLFIQDSRIFIIDNQPNIGLGASLKKAYRYIKSTDIDLVCLLPGDAQHDSNAIEPMFDLLIDKNFDYVKANRFIDRESLKQMPRFRRIGNIFITIITKFSTGYYSIFDSQNGSGVFRRSLLDQISIDFIGESYDYENTLLIALSIAGASVSDFPVKAIYGEETSTIKFFPTAIRALVVSFTGFWKRIWYKYILYNFHPIALFLLSGTVMMMFSLLFGTYLIVERILYGLSPSTGSVMIVVLPLILSVQLLLSAIQMDMNNENKHS